MLRYGMAGHITFSSGLEDMLIDALGHHSQTLFCWCSLAHYILGRRENTRKLGAGIRLA